MENCEFSSCFHCGRNYVEISIMQNKISPKKKCILKKYCANHYHSNGILIILRIVQIVVLIPTLNLLA